MRDILVVRHGEAYNTVKPDGQRRVPDNSNPPLTPYGERQAEETARVVEDFKPDFVIVSPFARVAQTAFPSLNASDMPAVSDIRLSEHFVFDNLKTFKGVTLSYYAELFGDRIEFPDELQDRSNYPSFGEPSEEVFARVKDFLEDWLSQEGWSRIAVFGHGATVGSLAKLLLPEQAEPMPMPQHCAISRFFTTDGVRWTASQYMDTSHLVTAVPR